MVDYVIRRVVWTFVLLALVSAVTFVIFYALPSGDPAVLRAGRQASPELVAQIRQSLGLDESLLVQYWTYMKAVVLHFDFGFSYQSSENVREAIVSRLPATISLTALSLRVPRRPAMGAGRPDSVRCRSADEIRAGSVSRRCSS